MTNLVSCSAKFTDMFLELVEFLLSLVLLLLPQLTKPLVSVPVGRSRGGSCTHTTVSHTGQHQGDAGTPGNTTDIWLHWGYQDITTARARTCTTLTHHNDIKRTCTLTSNIWGLLYYKLIISEQLSEVIIN